MILTDAERAKFIAYLEQSVYSAKLIEEQMAKFPHMETILRVNRIERMAEEVVLRKLRGIETQTIGDAATDTRTEEG